MTIAIMQPYFLPYIGYFQLMNAADSFVLYDNIKYTKKGWINRNRMLVNGKDEYFSLPLKKDSDYLNVDQRTLADTFRMEKNNLLRKIAGAYKKAPYFEIAFPLIEAIIQQQQENLFEFIHQSLISVCAYLDIETKFIISSSITIDHELRSQDKVLAICAALNATQYINPIGGIELYSKEAFKQRNIDLRFIKSSPIEYNQFGNEFVPWLSIMDVMMFNSKNSIKDLLNTNFTIL